MIIAHPFKSDNILGYRIVDRIGAGGYGEVFKVEAPGGILKALKIVGGFQDEKKAQNELAALDTVKKLRHPFLLSLERIEVVDQRLIVITELADKSLADLFNEYAAQGLPGIPREELLQYISETAEALDYLALEHRLQHLDVKPENLLLVGNHIKLADFGLVKHLQDDHVTMMAGLTPAYAAPELYDGRPSPFSDQYSLALVFYEMLTGERCFDGKSQAQLTAQHLSAKPNLSLMPKIDHPAMLRALAKKPELRFNSCREFVTALKNQKSLHRDKKRLLRNERVSVDEDTKSTVVDPVLNPRLADRTMVLSQNALREERRDAELVDFPVLENLSNELIPTLIIGVGRLGIEVCRRVKRRMENSLFHPEIPAIQILCLDTDRTPLDHPLSEDAPSILGRDEILHLPLRRPEEYRSRAKVHCEWLNRRWIYSVPKNLQTEGIRPLGRLAFIDNFDAFWKRLEEKAEKLSALDSLAISAERLGREFKRGKARVYIVSSISGGIGSGMTIDLAYAVKTLFSQVGLPTDAISAILLHGLNVHERDGNLSAANTLAFLSELAHIGQVGYQGEKTVLLPEVLDELPFDFPYFIDLGENIPGPEMLQKIDQIADYVFYNSCSTVGIALDRVRELECELGAFTLRSFGLSSAGLSPDTATLLIRSIVKSIVDGWLGYSLSNDENKQLPEDFLEDLSMQKLQEAFQAQLQQRSELVVNEAIAELRKKREAVADEIATVWKNIIKVYPDNDSNDAQASVISLPGNANFDLATFLVDRASSVVEEYRENVHRWLQSVFLGKRFSFATYFLLSKTAIEKIEAQQAAARTRANELRLKLKEMKRTIQALCDQPKTKVFPSNKIADFMADAVVLFDELFVQEALCLACRTIARHFSQHAESIQRARIHLDSYAKTVIRGEPLKDLERRSFGWERQVLQMFTAKLPALVDATELRFYTNAVAPLGSYRELLVNEPVHHDATIRELSLYAQNEIVAAARSLDVDSLANEASNRQSLELSDQITILVGQARPMLDQCGGVSRMLVAIPELSPTQMIAKAIEVWVNLQVQTVKATAGSLVLIEETENVEIPTITRRLLEKLPNCLDIAKRIRTRNDVNWTPIEQIL